ncbi:MAG: hypothetical protein JSV04_07275 [Candidatus Heimdallarchaeota archaeon]|nr:MAG: hypothetical protein JSV04_07275 [Candidatus Heimdallarchaeota archaeon]
MKMKKGYMIITLIILSHLLVFVPNTRVIAVSLHTENYIQSDWIPFNVTYGRADFDQTFWGVFVWEAPSEIYKYDVTVELDVTDVAVGIQVFSIPLDPFGSVYEPVGADITDPGTYTRRANETVKVGIRTPYPVIGHGAGSYRLTVHQHGDIQAEPLIDALILLGEIIAALVAIGAIVFGVLTFLRRSRLRKLEDAYLLNPEISLMDLVQGDQKKYLKLKKRLLEKGFLRDQDA